MAERERQEGRIRAAENRWQACDYRCRCRGGGATPSCMALHATIAGDGEEGEGRVRTTEAGTSRGSGTDSLPNDLSL
jgi:hypothetical protein